MVTEIPRHLFAIESSRLIMDQVRRALLAVGASPSRLQVEPLKHQGLLISATIRDQEVRTLVPAGMTVAWEDIATTLTDQLHPDNGGVPFNLRIPEVLPS